MADIFISYKREDARVAERLSIALESLGFEVWWDFGLLSGQRFRKVIEQVIDQCSAAVVLWSALARESEFVVDEASYAKEQGKLCPARIDECRLPMGFGGLHTDDLSGWDGELSHPGLQQLVAALEAKTGKKARLGAPRRDEAARERAAELEAFKAAQLAGSESALRAFVSQFPAGAFTGFVKSQLAVMAEAGAGAQTEARAAHDQSLQRERDARLAAEARASEAERRVQTPPQPAAPVETTAKSAPPWRLIAAGAAALALLIVAIASINGMQDQARTRAESDARDREIAAQLEETRAAAEESTWRVAEQAQSVAGYEEYIRAFPSGAHVAQAQQARADLQAEQERLTREAAARSDDEAWARAQSDNNVAAYNAYVSAHRSGAHVADARRAIERLERQRLQAAAAPATSTTTPAATSGAYNLALLHPDVRAAVEQARQYEQRANQAAERARDAARRGRDAAARARAGEAGMSRGGTGWPSTWQYEGEFSDGQANGLGAAHSRSPEDGYAGQWRAGRPHGLGVRDSNGVETYAGDWEFEARHGYGVQNLPTGLWWFSGSWRHDRSGSGVWHWHDGRRYEGEYSNDRRNGHGVFWDEQGRVISQGIWRDDVLQTALAP